MLLLHFLGCGRDFCRGPFDDYLHNAFADMMTTVELNKIEFLIDFETDDEMNYIVFKKIALSGVEIPAQSFTKYDLQRLEREIYRKFFKKDLRVNLF